MADFGINTLGSGTGYIYVVSNDAARTISVFNNNSDGVREARKIANIVGPIAANRSAVAKIEITAAGATGNLTAININGVNQIAANVPCVSAVPANVAPTWAAAVNSFSPGSGIKFTAFAIDEFVYLVADASAGASANGLTINIVTDTGTLVATVVQQLINGSSNSGVGDDNIGYLFYLNSQTDAIPNPTFPLSADYLDISKYLIGRGLQAGIVTIDQEIEGDRLSTNRYSAFTTYIMDTEGGAASDNLEFINSDGLIEGDFIYLKCSSASRPITVVSAPLATLTTPNIYLNDNTPFVLDSIAKTLVLQYHYDSTLGGIFNEIGRSSPSSNIAGSVTYVSSTFGSDETGKINRIDLPFASINAAINAVTAAASLNNTITVMAGSYTITNAATFLSTCKIDLLGGANLTIASSAAAPLLTTLSITGIGNVTWAKFIDTANFPLLATLTVNCNNWTTSTSTINTTTLLLAYNINATGTMIFGGALTLDTNSGLAYSKIILTAPEPDFTSGGIYHTDSNINLIINPTGGKAKGFVNIRNQTSKLWDFIINGSLEWLINPAVAAVTINGNAWFNNYNNFIFGFKVTDTIICSNSVPAINLTNARVSITCRIKHNLPAPADVPTIKINSVTGSTVLDIDSESIENFNSTGVSGVIYIDNTTFAHTVQSNGKIQNLSTAGSIFVAAIATAVVLNRNTDRNVTLNGANVSITAIGNTTSTSLI